jgi:ribosomal protein S27E
MADNESESRDLVFKCPNCEQDLAVDSSGAGSEITCPACGQSIVIPHPDSLPESVVNPIKSSAEARVVRHFKVPQHSAEAGGLIEKPLAPLEVVAKEASKLRVKTFKRSDCVEVGKDHFDDHVSRFLEQVGEGSIIGIHPITYTHQDLASRDWITDFGVLIVYKG